MNKTEQKFSPIADIKAVAATGEFEGYASVFGVTDSYGDIVMRGAFENSLSERERKRQRPSMLYNHDSDNHCGHWVEMREDDRGLYVKGKLWVDGEHPDPHALKALRFMQSPGQQAGLSIGFQATKREIDEKTHIRRLLEVDLWEVSVVTFPANDMARVTDVRSSITTVRQFEEFLRDNAGFSAKLAKSVASRGFKPDELRDEASSTPAELRDEAAIAEKLRRNIQLWSGKDA